MASSSSIDEDLVRETPDLAQYVKLCQTKTDINEQLPILSRYATKCSVILEAGVRSVRSTWAFLNGLQKNRTDVKRLYSVDIQPAPIDEARRVAEKLGVELTFTQSNILTYEMPEKADLVFIDTFHCYGQLKRELALLAPKARTYIVMHDTTIDGTTSEVVRCKFNIPKIRTELGWTREELVTGLWPAIEEFLAVNSDWKLHHRFVHNNGLTILKRRKD